MEKIRISVRNFLEFLMRSGDIDQRISKSGQTQAMLEGAKLHRRIQKSMGSTYEAEVPLKIEVCREEYILSLEGRADGIIKEDPVIIDEIKGMFCDVMKMEEPVAIHLAQAKCYAYMYVRLFDQECIKVQMTYASLGRDEEEIKYFTYTYSAEELESWFMNLVLEYDRWAVEQMHQKEQRRASIEKLQFPFPYREGQKQLAAAVYRTLEEGAQLFVEAPTGAGKTMACVFPAVKAVGEGYGDKIFYLTAKTITKSVAKEAFYVLKDHGYAGKLLEITAKEKICPMDDMLCNPQACMYAKGHFDRVNDALFHVWTTKDVFLRKQIQKAAEEYKVCPYEFQLDLAQWADDIVCDYNYAFDPNAHLKRFFSEGSKGDHLFLVDEAHNLVNRAREMYSATLIKEDFLRVKKILNSHNKKITKQLEACNKVLLEWKRQCDGYMVHEQINELIFKLLRLASTMDEFLRESDEFAGKEEVVEFYMTLRGFMMIYDLLDENYVIYSEITPEDEFALHLFCVDTASNLKSYLDRGRGVIFFSATFLPIQYYKHLLSTYENPYAIYARSTFSKEQSCVLVGADVSSLYSRRTREEFEHFAEYLKGMALSKQGNYIAFFPSYKMMRQVYEVFMNLEEAKQVEVVVQERRMLEADREEFLEAFEKKRNQSLLAFCVLGGIFSEGIDLKGSRLIGAAIIGTALPMVCNERDILKNYYSEQGKNGFDYAYTYEGMTKVLQAAGRVIRTKEDYGVILLLDERFMRNDMQGLFPMEWSHRQVCNLTNFKGKLENFWKTSLLRIEDEEGMI
ncbi:ATP-dependent DNA helicase [Eubacterium oxidoreducens]|uniref:Rad3-related DNA helicase n=1 Tax=Eubacterium oxidoreducens TaxID=1732 RepID=A0A1G6C1G4_EUBOX|nr:ATP-dependent DNA helicase [Eubacterium oxidoreducens]SDB26685.1 Rad3-related DNA helicase [Eubacterium oxidoreducens]